MKKLIIIIPLLYSFASQAQTINIFGKFVGNTGDTIIYKLDFKRSDYKLYDISSARAFLVDSTRYGYVKQDANYVYFFFIVANIRTERMQWQGPDINWSCSFNVDNYNGIINGISDEYFENTQNIKEVKYFTLNGVEIENANNYEGVLIKKLITNNGIITTKNYAIR